MCSSWSAERVALAADVLRRTGRLRMRVHGESMLPALWPHDEVEIVSCQMDDVHPGDIVLAHRDGRFFLHRFIARTSGGFLLSGDSVPNPDPVFPAAALAGRLLCRVEGKKRTSRAALGPGLGAKCSRVIGRLLCHCSPARRFVLKLHRRRRESLQHREVDIAIDHTAEACPAEA